jgi:hypothetical protein
VTVGPDNVAEKISDHDEVLEELAEKYGSDPATYLPS